MTEEFSLFIGDALLHVDHLLFGQAVELHRDKGADPPEYRQSEVQSHSYPFDCRVGASVGCGKVFT